jgi:hypothetical protein
MAQFDISNVVRHFLNSSTPERRELMKEFREEVIRNPAMRRFVSEVGQEAMKNRATPVMTLGIGVLYGMALGVLLERDRTREKKRIQ